MGTNADSISSISRSREHLQHTCNNNNNNHNNLKASKDMTQIIDYGNNSNSSSSSSSSSNSPRICNIDLGKCKRLKTRVATNNLHNNKIGSRWQSSKSKAPLKISSLIRKIILLLEVECAQSLQQQTYQRIGDEALVFHDF